MATTPPTSASLLASADRLRAAETRWGGVLDVVDAMEVAGGRGEVDVDVDVDVDGTGTALVRVRVDVGATGGALMVDVGAGVFVRMTTSEAKAFATERMREMRQRAMEAEREWATMVAVEEALKAKEEWDVTSSRASGSGTGGARETLT